MPAVVLTKARKDTFLSTTTFITQVKVFQKFLLWKHQSSVHLVPFSWVAGTPVNQWELVRVLTPQRPVTSPRLVTALPACQVLDPHAQACPSGKLGFECQHSFQTFNLSTSTKKANSPVSARLDGSAYFSKHETGKKSHCFLNNSWASSCCALPSAATAAVNVVMVPNKSCDGPDCTECTMKLREHLKLANWAGNTGL